MLLLFFCVPVWRPKAAGHHACLHLCLFAARIAGQETMPLSCKAHAAKWLSLRTIIHHLINIRFEWSYLYYTSNLHGCQRFTIPHIISIFWYILMQRICPHDTKIVLSEAANAKAVRCEIWSWILNPRSSQNRISSKKAYRERLLHLNIFCQHQTFIALPLYNFR